MEKKKKPLNVKQQRARDVVGLYKRYYPKAQCALNYETPLQLLIATILSAQCTDERVNIVTEPLFKKYKTAKDFSKAKLNELEKAVHSTGFYKNKAKNIKSCCTDLVEKYRGEVPQKLELLVELAGVGRKTAHVVLGNAFGISSGVVVDTHVTRLSNRMKLVNTKNAQIIERELNAIIPKRYWIQFSHWMIHHGRGVCKAQKPRCETCFLEDLCPKKL